MPRKATPITLSQEERTTLERWVRGRKTEQQLAERARIVLLADAGRRTDEIAKHLRTSPVRVSKWRTRFARERLAALSDRPRSGAPPRYDQTTRQRILAQLDQPPPSGHATWTGALLAAALGDVSKHQVWRVLRKHQISLRRRRSWCLSTDPEFARKAADVVGVYLDPPDNAVVLAVDEKPHIQALERAQGWLRLPNGQALTGFFARLQAPRDDDAVRRARSRHRLRHRRSLLAPPAARLPRFHEPSGRSLRGLPTPRRARQSQHPQAQARPLVEAPPQRPFPLHPDAGLVAESGRDLVLHPEPPSAAGSELHESLGGTRGH